MKSLIYIFIFTVSSFSANLTDTFPRTPLHSLFKVNKKEFSKFEHRTNEALQQQPDDPDNKLMFAELALFHNDLIAAQTTLIGYAQDDDLYKVHYMLARVYALQNQVAQATDHLLKALKTPEPFPDMLMDIQLLTEHDSIADIEKFWRLNDPTPVSPENEYTSVAFKRIDYVLRNFINDGGIDDRGKIYMRYGEPDKREIFTHYRHSSECWVYNKMADRVVFFDFIKSVRYIKYTLVKDYNMIEGKVWSNLPGEAASGLADASYNSEMNQTFRSGADPYASPLGAQDPDSGPPSKFFFTDRKDIHEFYASIAVQLQQAAVGNLDVGSGSQSQEKALNEGNYYTQKQLLHYQAVVDEQTQTLPRTVVQLQQKLIKPTISYARFKHGADIRVELYYALPYNEISSNKDVLLTQNFSLKDNDFQTLGMGTSEWVVQPGGDPSSYIINQQNILFSPDESSIFCLEISDQDNQFISTASLQFDLKNFKQDTLFLSDMQLSTFSTAGDDSKYSKNGMYIQPYPFDQILKNSPLYIYFEIYRLAQEQGKTRFNVTCAVLSKTDQTWMEQLRGKPKTYSIAFQNEYSGTRKTDSVFFQLDSSNFIAGENVIRITVTDRITGKSTSIDKTIQIVNQTE